MMEQDHLGYWAMCLDFDEAMGYANKAATTYRVKMRVTKHGGGWYVRESEARSGVASLQRFRALRNQRTYD